MGPPPKLPIKQLAILAVARLCEPIALTSVFPYLPSMIESFGVEKKSVAKWAGVIAFVFSFSQALTAVAWGRASDKFGRKYVIVAGLTSTMTTFLVWGMTTSLPMAILVRGILGAGNGNVGIIRTAVAELVREKELQPAAFSLMPLVWSIGSVFGPMFGGFLAEPTRQWPALFGGNRFLQAFPYALPNLVAAIFFLISLATAILFLEETLDSRKHTKDWGLVAGTKLKRLVRACFCVQRRIPQPISEDATPLLDSPLLESHAAGKFRAPPPKPRRRFPLREVFTPQTVVNLVAYTFLALHSVAADQILAVFFSYPVQKPDAENTRLPFYFSTGLGLQTNRIGTIFTCYGVACGLIQFLLFPRICRKLGALYCYKACVLTFPLIYLVLPYVALIQDTTLRYTALLVIMLVKAFAVIFGFPCITILLTNSTTSLDILGTVNGFATTFSALGRAVGPAATGMAFTWGVTHGYVIVPWWLLAGLAALGAVPAWYIVEGDGPSSQPQRQEDIVDDDEDDDEESGLGLLPDDESRQRLVRVASR